jgi:trk system potassium uptake protein TrkH
VTIPLMLAGSTNFHTMWWALAGRRGLHRSPELRVAVAALALAIPALLFALGSRGGETSGLRIAVFETVSALTTTGFSITSYRGWPSTAVLSLVVLMIVGGGTGSTAGGVKQLRVYLLMRSLVWEIQRALAPSRALRVLTIERGGFRERVEPDALVQANVVLVMYLFCLIGLMATMTAYGYSLADALFESASTLSTVGLSVGVTSPDTPAPVLAMQTVGMLLGRLELVIVATALVRGLRDGIDMLRTRAA